MQQEQHQDKLFRFIFDELDLRGELVYLDQSWHRVQEHCDYPGIVRKQLGEALAAAAILSATIKHEGSLILQVQGDGPISTLVAQAGHTGKLRGLAKWRGAVPEGSLSELYGKGQMAMTVNSKEGERYQSIVALQGRDLSDALEHYFMNSEQLGSRFWLFVSEQRVAGLFLQQLPARRRDPDAWERLTTLAETATAAEVLSLPPEALLRRLFHDEQVRLFEPRELRFSCSCSREKIENTLLAMGRDSIRDVVESEGSVEVDCEFCNRHYSFSEAEIERLFAYQDPDGGGDIIH